MKASAVKLTDTGSTSTLPGPHAARAGMTRLVILGVGLPAPLVYPNCWWRPLRTQAARAASHGPLAPPPGRLSTLPVLQVRQLCRQGNPQLGGGGRCLHGPLSQRGSAESECATVADRGCPNPRQTPVEGSSDSCILNCSLYSLIALLACSIPHGPQTLVLKALFSTEGFSTAPCVRSAPIQLAAFSRVPCWRTRSHEVNTVEYKT